MFNFFTMPGSPTFSMDKLADIPDEYFDFSASNEFVEEQLPPEDRLYTQLKQQTETYNTAGNTDVFRGYAWDTNKGGMGSFDNVLKDMAKTLADKGVTSLDQLTVGEEPVYKEIPATPVYRNEGTGEDQGPVLVGYRAYGQIYSPSQVTTVPGYNNDTYTVSVQQGTKPALVNKDTGDVVGTSTGQDGQFSFGTTYAGHGATTYNFFMAPDGTPVLNTTWGDTSEAGDWALPLTLASMFAAPGLAGALGGGVTGAAGAGAILGGSQAAILGGDPIEGALKGGLLGGVSAGAQQIVGPSVSEAVGGGVLGDAAGGAVAGGLQAALTGGDVLQSALRSGLMSGAASLQEQPEALPYDYASDAAQLAEQGIGAEQITDILGAADAPVDLASSMADYAVNAVNSGLMGPDVTNYIENEITNDVKFAAADANQLYEQGLSNQQVQNTLDATKQPSPITELGLDASFIAEDARQLYDQTNNVMAVEQNLLATGVDPFVAAAAANEAAFGASPDQITDVILEASNPVDLTTEQTLFATDPNMPSSLDLSPIKTKVVPGTEKIPTVQAGQDMQQSSNIDDSLFLLDRSRYASMQNPFLRPASSYRSIIGSIFNG